MLQVAFVSRGEHLHALARQLLEDGIPQGLDYQGELGLRGPPVAQPLARAPAAACLRPRTPSAGAGTEAHRLRLRVGLLLQLPGLRLRLLQLRDGCQVFLETPPVPRIFAKCLSIEFVGAHLLVLTRLHDPERVFVCAQGLRLVLPPGRPSRRRAQQGEQVAAELPAILFTKRVHLQVLLAPPAGGVSRRLRQLLGGGRRRRAVVGVVARGRRAPLLRLVSQPLLRRLPGGTPGVPIPLRLPLPAVSSGLRRILGQPLGHWLSGIPRGLRVPRLTFPRLLVGRDSRWSKSGGASGRVLPRRMVLAMWRRRHDESHSCKARQLKRTPPQIAETSAGTGSGGAA
mmetsp:Transcript_91530/g.294128  ORF Transcript_91530/g.294128 Transcript_91530/m.294128 type:complete len:342 (+) Transcript_91530:502-1527(+)